MREHCSSDIPAVHDDPLVLSVADKDVIDKIPHLRNHRNRTHVRRNLYRAYFLLDASVADESPAPFRSISCSIA